MSAHDLTALADSEARRRAVTDFEHNLVVVAGAGTGKTSLLVERILIAIGSGAAEIDHIAALTFTEKAASEIRSRLALELETLRRAALSGNAHEPDLQRAGARAWRLLAAQPGAGAETIAARCLAALSRLDQASVVTIHTFCAQILRAWAMPAGVDPAFAVDEGEEFELIFDDGWDAFLRVALGPESGDPDLWKRVLASVGLGPLRSIARALARFDVPLEAMRAAEHDHGARLVTRLAIDTAGRLDELLHRASGITPRSIAFLEGLRDALVAMESGIAQLQSVVAGNPELARKIVAGNPPRPTKSLAGVTPDEFEEIVREAYNLVRDLLKVDEQPFQDVIEALFPFCIRLRETFLARGFVGFDGLLVLARDLLRDHLPAREALKRRLRMILVDEFQDTDPLQYEIVLYLGERAGESARDAYEANLDPGRLFIVGDPKQSIYRFRGADYTAFDRASRRVVATGGIELTLQSSFRSLPGVVLPINSLFRPHGASHWIESGYQPRYAPIAAAREATHSPAVEVWTVTAADGTPPPSAAERRRIEGRALAREIAQMVEAQHAGSFAEITVLLRSFSPLTHYLRAFREAGVPFVVTGGREFLARPEVSHLLAVLRALAHPSDPVALLAYLRSPIGGVPDHELAAFAGTRARFSFRTTPDARAFPTLAPALARLRALEDETRDLPVVRVVGHVLRATGLAIVSAVAFEGAQRVSNLDKLAAAAAELAADGSASMSDVLDAIEEQRTGSLEADSPLDDEGSNAVRISTVHAAKGLENRFIFVADLARETNHGGTSPEVLIAWTPERIPVAAFSIGSARSAARVWLDRENDRHGVAEEIRVLYVALTRARDRLVVLGATPHRGRAPGAWILALAPWAYDSLAPPEDGATIAGDLVRHRVVRDAPPTRRDEVESNEDVDGAQAAYDAALARMRTLTRPPLARPSGTEDRLEIEDAAPIAQEIAVDRSVARAAGSAVHRFLEAWDGRGDEPAILRRLAEQASRMAAAVDCDPADVQREAAEIIHAFLRSPLAEQFRSLTPLAREVPALLARDGTAWRGTIDLVYRDADGAVVVADFKTDRESREAIAAPYRAQVEVYREAVRRALCLAEAPSCELWWLRQGVIDRW